MSETKKTRRVLLGDESSSWSDVLSGVPQGSVLGPILFIIFKNDLLETLTNPGKLYADDSKLMSEITDSASAIDFQNDIDKMVNWTAKWKMFFNCSKCKIMHIQA